MEYGIVEPGTFIRRVNRFIAEVAMDGRTERVHVRTTGRCGELFVEGAPCWLEKSAGGSRKTAYSLVAVEKDGALVNTDSQIPNRVVEEALRAGAVEGFADLSALKREAAIGHSRFDFYYEAGGRKGYIEVKGVTLEEEGLALFPDAPTQRGRKHVALLSELQAEGYKNAVLFLVQMEGIRRFSANSAGDPAFAKTLEEAASQGVDVLVYNTKVTPSHIEIADRIEWIQGVAQ